MNYTESNNYQNKKSRGRKCTNQREDKRIQVLKQTKSKDDSSGNTAENQFNSN